PLCALLTRRPPRPPLFPYTKLFRSLTNLTPDEFVNDPTVVRIVENGSPSDCIADVAAEIGADLTILGTHEYGTVHKHLLGTTTRSEEHTSELQSRGHLVCRLLLEQK